MSIDTVTRYVCYPFFSKHTTYTLARIWNVEYYNIKYVIFADALICIDPHTAPSATVGSEARAPSFRTCLYTKSTYLEIPQGIRVLKCFLHLADLATAFLHEVWMECQVLQGPRTNLCVGFLSCHLTRYLASLAHWHPSHLHRPECSWSVGADKIVRIIVSFQKLRYYIYYMVF